MKLDIKLREQSDNDFTLSVENLEDGSLYDIIVSKIKDDLSKVKISIVYESDPEV